MKRLWLCVVVLILLYSSVAFGQGRSIRANYITVTQWISNFGNYDQIYRGSIEDAFKINYTGSGNYILNLQGDGVSVLTLDKNGNLVVAGGIVGSVAIPDLDGTHFLTLRWNENDAANRILSFQVNGANAQLSVEGTSSIINQDLTTDAASTFAGLTLSGLTASRLVATNGAKALTSSDLSSWIAGTADDVTVTNDGDGTVTLSTVDISNVYYVAAAGGDYTTIQTALNANTSAGVFLVGPGTYTDDTISFTANEQTVRGLGLTPNQVVTTADATICNYGAYTGCRIENMKMTLTDPDSAVHMITGSGTLFLRWCHLGVTVADKVDSTTQPRAIGGTGAVKMRKGTIDYDNTNVYNSALKAPIEVGAGGSVDLSRVNIDVDCSGADTLVSTSVLVLTTGTVEMNRCHVDVDDDDATYTVGMVYATGSGSHEFFNNNVHVVNDTAGKSAIGWWLSSVTSMSVRSMYNHFHAESSAGTAQGFVIGANCTLISQMDDIVAADADTVTGTLTYAHSRADGTLDVGAGLNVADDGYVGLGSATGRIEFDDAATDTVNILNAHVGIGTNTPNYFGFGGAAKVLTIDGTSNQGVLEFATSKADAAGNVIGEFIGWNKSNDSGYREAARMRVLTEGGTANKRGGAITFWTTPDNNPTEAEAMRITNAGDVGIGTDAPDDVLHIGNVSNKMVVNPDGGGIVYSGTARPTRYIFLDVNLSVIDADGSNNLGVVTVESDNTNYRNFVRWTGTGSGQDIDLYWEFLLPANFSAWAAANSLSIDVRKDVAGDTATLYMYDAAGTVDPGINGADITPAGVDTWTTANDQPTAAYSAGQFVRIRCVLYNNITTETVDLARLYLSYLASN